MLSLVLNRVFRTVMDRREIETDSLREVLRRYVGGMARLWWTLQRTPSVVPARGPSCTVVLASFRRMANLTPIVRSVLRLGCVARVLVTNNNPAVKLGRRLRLRDPRLEVVEQPVARPPGIRFDLALEQPGERFLVLDDDLFLAPHALALLLAALERDPSVVHGVQGEIFDPVGRRCAPAVRYVDQRVHVLNRVYCFTKAHLVEYHRLAADLAERGFGSVGLWDDVLLSAAGDGHAQVHRVGFWPDCPSGIDRKTAVFLSGDGFRAERMRVFDALAESKPGFGTTLVPPPQFPWVDAS
jgi:hypothetical protein